MKELGKDIGIAIGAIDELIADDVSNKTELSKIWERTAAFTNGNQMMSSTPAIAQVSGPNFFISENQDTRSQMYVTNEIESIVRTIVSYMTRARSSVDIYPASKIERDKQSARIAERVMLAKYDLDNEVMNSRKAAYYACVFGTVFRKDFWDTSLGAMHEIPSYDQSGNEVVDPQTGEVELQEYPQGDNAVAILTPLSIGTDWSCPEFSRIPYIFEQYLIDIDWAKESFDRQEAGYTGKADQLTAGAGLNGPMTVLEQMKYASPQSAGGAKIVTKNKVLMTEFYIAPTRDLPRGRQIIKAGATVLYDSFNKGQDLGNPYFLPFTTPVWHPYSMYQFAPYVGRLLGKSLVEGLMPQQMRINEINGAILMNAGTMAKTIWLAAERQLKKGVLVGIEGIVNTYTPRPDAPPPQRMSGVPLPIQFFKEKEDLRQQMVREAGANFMGQGDIPPGVTAASALQMILENSNAQQADAMIGWEKFHEDGFTKKIRLIRQHCSKGNQQVVDYLRTIDSEALDNEISYFKGEDFGDGLTLKIEAGSMIPKNEKAKREFYDKVSQGFMAQSLMDPSPRGEEIRAQYFELNGMEGFDTPETSELKKAKWENGKLIKGQSMQVNQFDVAAIHMPCHTSQIQDPNFLEKHPPGSPVFQVTMAHIQQHQAIEADKQKQAMAQQLQAQQAAMSPPAQGGPPPTALPPQQQAA